MPALENPRHERFAQGLAQGKTATLAYSEAGYVDNRFNASALKTKQHIIARVMELQGNRVERLIITRQYVIDALLENAEKALGRKPVKIGAEAKEVYVYRGDVANAAIRLAGLEVGMFVDRKEVTHLGDFDKYSDSQIVEMLRDEATALLEHQAGDKANETENSSE